MRTDPNVRLDGNISFLGGMDSGRAPGLLPQNAVSMAVNVTFRGGYCGQRPGMHRRKLVFEDTEILDWFEDNNFQGAGTYKGWLVVMVRGRLFYIDIKNGDPVNGYRVEEITPTKSTAIATAFVSPPVNGSKTISVDSSLGMQVGYPLWVLGGKYQISSISGNSVTILNIEAIPGIAVDVDSSVYFSDPNIPEAKQVWMQEAEKYLIVQNGIDKAIIYDSGARRADNSKNEVPVGTVMAYGMGRLWVAVNEREFVAGDIAGGGSGKGISKSGDEVIFFTENNYLNGGGKFIVPSDAGPITGMKFISNLDTSLGQGPLQVFTPNSVFSVNAPVERETWQNLTNPIQTHSLIGNGALSHKSIVLVNGDIFFRAKDGLRSFVLARRDFGTWGNTPISTEMHRIMLDEDEALMYNSSSVLFDNRLLFSVGPQYGNGDVYYRGLGALDFHLISSMGQKVPPVYDGVWTGVNPLQILTMEIDGRTRCFIFSKSGDNTNELWELSKNDKFDQNGGKIESFIESRGMRHIDNPFEANKLIGAELWYDEIEGEVDFIAKYRPDQYPCWFDWATWQECQTMRDCNFTATSGSCWTPPDYQPGFRSRVSVPKPASVCVAMDNKRSDVGYEFQMKLEWHGRARIKHFALKVQEIQESPNPNLVC